MGQGWCCKHHWQEMFLSTFLKLQPKSVLPCLCLRGFLVAFIHSAAAVRLLAPSIAWHAALVGTVHQ
jgi:hypothetical protein